MCCHCGGPCPKGVPVNDTLRCLSYVDSYGEYALGRERFQALPEQVRALRCSDCSQCLAACPHRVRVRPTRA